MKRSWLFWAALGAQLLLLTAMIGLKSYTLAEGTPVVLKTAPVDPWDLFRGDYVRLNYEISSLDSGLAPGGGRDLRRNQTVYVLLKRGQPFWQAVAIRTDRPPASPDEVALKGRVSYVYPDRILLQYGLESYYLPEGRGRELEEKLRPPHPADIAVEVAVDAFGNSAILHLLVNGQIFTPE